MPGVDRPASAPAGTGTAPAAPAGRPPRIVGFLCDFAVDVSAFTAANGTLRDLPHVTLIKVPCSGFVRPAWLEFALRNGAEGAFVCGCPLGDCFNRLGNNLIGDRVVQLRRRFERQRIHPDRIAAIYYGLHDHEGFLGAVRAFSDRVAALPGPVVPAPRAAAARPAAAAAPARPAAPPGAASPSASPSAGSRAESGPGERADGAAPEEEP
ncbi:MAG TPA: hydrogenase iron-sulfur subunit [bacterium]|nr:hydrogenase iron-sulfur subunit [bacterium]